MSRDIIKLNSAIAAAASAVGGREHEGPLSSFFDIHDAEDRFGMDTWEKAESEMQRIALSIALSKSYLRAEKIDAIFAGDLLNQCVGSAYGLLGFKAPYFGLYGACSTAAEGLLLASIMVSNRVFARCASVSSSHNCAAERQYRTPLEYGGQRTPTAQWTATAGGAFLTERWDGGYDCAVIQRGLPGKVQDRGVNDPNNMGAAMAPAALDTLVRFFEDTGESPTSYDLIVTGDLGFEGGSLLCSLMEAEGYSIRGRYADYGQLIYDRQRQDVHCGGSGCGCSAVVLASHLLPMIERGELERILFLATGAMMSPDSVKQGRNIPAVAHLLEIVHAKEGRK